MTKRASASDQDFSPKLQNTCTENIGSIEHTCPPFPPPHPPPLLLRWSLYIRHKGCTTKSFAYPAPPSHCCRYLSVFQAVRLRQPPNRLQRLVRRQRGPKQARGRKNKSANFKTEYPRASNIKGKQIKSAGFFRQTYPGGDTKHRDQYTNTRRLSAAANRSRQDSARKSSIRQTSRGEQKSQQSIHAQTKKHGQPPPRMPQAQAIPTSPPRRFISARSAKEKHH